MNNKICDMYRIITERGEIFFYNEYNNREARSIFSLAILLYLENILEAGVDKILNEHHHIDLTLAESKKDYNSVKNNSNLGQYNEEVKKYINEMMEKKEVKRCISEMRKKKEEQSNRGGQGHREFVDRIRVSGKTNNNSLLGAIGGGLKKLFTHSDNDLPSDPKR